MGQKQAKPRQAERGDHIFRIIPGRQYFHHGIYVGDNMVIHFVGYRRGNSSSSSKGPGLVPDSSPPCKICGHQRDTKIGVIKTCIDCFGLGKPILIYNYNLAFIKRYFGCPKPPDEVVNTATNLLRDGFGDYSLLHKNCEHFATFCKTGKAKSKQARPRVTDVILGD